MARTEGAEGPNREDPLSNDNIYDVLSDKRRRYTLHHLKQRDGPVSIRELAEQVAAWENRKAIEDLTSQERKRVYIALYQSHLPSMAKEGIVDYDADRGMVELTSTIEDVSIYLEIVPDEDIPWSLYYIGLSAANALLVFLAWQGVEPFAAIPDLGVAVIVLVSFGVSAFVQIYRGRQMQIGDEGPPPEIKKL